MADMYPVCTWKSLTLIKTTSRGLTSSPSYAYSAYGFSLQPSQARLHGTGRVWRLRPMHLDPTEHAHFGMHVNLSVTGCAIVCLDPARSAGEVLRGWSHHPAVQFQLLWLRQSMPW